MKVILCGGGTMGSVSPLLAIYDELHLRDASGEALFIGTKDGPERAFVESLGIQYYFIRSGKFRRYVSGRNLFDVINILIGTRQAKKILCEFKPDVILTAGSFVCYPVAKAAHALRIPLIIHQQDIVKGLANRLMEKYAKVVTITFDQSLSDFDIKKTFYTSNPARRDLLTCDGKKAPALFQLDPSLPTALVMGGGSGASAINQLTLEALGALTESAQVVHLTGAGKSVASLIPDYYDRETVQRIQKRYHPIEFVTQGMCELLAHADVVVSRAGLSSLTELSLLKKPSVIIPIPDSHQEQNAAYFAKFNAVKSLNQKELSGATFAAAVLSLVSNPAEREVLSKNIGQMIDAYAGRRYVDLIYKVLGIA